MSTNRRPITMLVVSLLTLSLAGAACSDAGISSPSAPLEANSRSDVAAVMEIVIQVSPATIILDSPGTWVTVHAEIPYSDVDHATLTMNGVELVYSKSDNRGELVVKFAREDIQGIVSPPEALLTLTGTTNSGETFIGSEVVPVQ
jgi:hypothetical protein